MRRLLDASEAALRWAASNAEMEVIVVRLASGGLVKNPGRAQQGLWRRFVARRVSKQPRLELVGAKQPFHARLFVHQECANQVPVSCFVEVVELAMHRTEAETIETHPAVVRHGEPTPTARKEDQVRISSGAMAAVTSVRPTARSRKVPDAQWIAPGKGLLHGSCSPLDRADEGWRPIPARLSRSQPPKPLSSVSERSRRTQVSRIERAHRDRLLGQNGLGDAGRDR
jgi:hypothetical protein